MHRLSLLGAIVGLVVVASAGPVRGQANQFLGKPLAAWAKDLQHPSDPVVRRSAAFALGKMGSHAVGTLPQLLLLLQEDKTASVREAAAFALGEISRESLQAANNATLIPALRQALAKDPDPLVRRSAAVALGGLGPQAEAARDALSAAIGDSDPAVRQNVAWALGRLGPEALSGLKKALADPDALVRRDAANSVGLLGTEAHGAVPELLACCQHPDVEVKKAALAALVRLVGPEDASISGPLRQALTDRDVEVRRNAALALGNIGGDDAAAAVPVLVEALGSPDMELSRQAAAALKNIGPAARAAVDPLRKALTNPDEQLRSNAALALGGLAKDAESAVPDLLKVLADEAEKPSVRAEAAVALARIGDVPAARDSIATLVRVLQNETTDAKVRERVLWTLRSHQKQLLSYPQVFEALAKILSEPRLAENRMLRYDAAYLLGSFKQSDAPPQTLDVLLEFLQDKSILIYSGTITRTPGAGQEKGSGNAQVQETGKGDGRVMAVFALRRIGAERVRTRPEILQQLRAIAQAPDTLEDLRKATREALTAFAP